MNTAFFKRWLPLIGVAFLSVHTIAHEAGYHKADVALSTIADTVPIEQASPIPASDIVDAVTKLVAAFASLAGVGLKLKSVLDKALPPSAGSDIKSGALVVLVVALLAQPAIAQEPTPTPKAGISVNLYGGAMRTAERGKPDSNDFTYRLTLNFPAPAQVTGACRADWTRTQDGGNLYDPKTFRSIEAFCGGRRAVATGLEVVTFTGVSWSRDGAFEPADPRLWTLAAGVRGSIAGKGSAQIAFGHHGPVGGPALLGSLSYQVGDTAFYFADVAIPTDDARFRQRPYTVRFGISARLKAWRF